MRAQRRVGGQRRLGRDDLRRGVSSSIARSYDAREGGFGSAPKFPRPVDAEFSLPRLRARSRRIGATASTRSEMDLFTLRKMAAGGMHDHLGGGFHRYSVDAFWHVPHFEKMLYDQAQLAVAYLDAFQITHEPQFEERRARHSRLCPARHDREGRRLLLRGGRRQP